MRRPFLILLAVLLMASLAAAQSSPRITTVEPASGKAGDQLTVEGQDLSKEVVIAVFLSDESKDYPADVVEQTAEKIVMKVPSVTPGDYNISIQVDKNIFIQPVRFTVE